MPQVMVISSEGYFYSYSIDLENGGECSLLKQYRYVTAALSARFSHTNGAFQASSILTTSLRTTKPYGASTSAGIIPYPITVFVVLIHEYAGTDRFRI